MVVKRLAAGGLLAVALVACSGSDTKSATSPEVAGASGTGGSKGGGGGGNGSGPNGGATTVGTDTSLADFPGVYAAALCSTIARCWTAFVDATGGVDGCAQLFERVGEDGDFARLKEAVADGRLTYHPEALPGCLQQLEAASCAGYQDALCPDLFVGTKQAGEPCEIDQECVGDSQCLVESSCPGTCGARRALGEPCTDFNACAAGLRCGTLPDASRACVKPVGLGEKCGTFLPCAGLLYCLGSEIGATEPTGTCIERDLPHDGEPGASCDGLGAEALCKAGFVCSFVQENGETVGRCQPQAVAGGACTYSMPDACPATQYCHIDTELGVKPATGTCTPRPQLGDTCRYGTIHTAPCGSDAVCHPDTEVCVAIKRLGDACTSGEECASSDCDETGHCVALLECAEAGLTTDL